MSRLKNFSTHDFSVRRFLLVALIGAVALLGTVSGFLSYHDARHEISELFDAQLAESAKILLAEASHEISELETEPEHEETKKKSKEEEEDDDDDDDESSKHRYNQRTYFQIWNHSGRLLMRSEPTVPTKPLSTVDAGYANHHLNGEHYRIFVLWDKHHKLQIQVAQILKTRERFAGDIALHMMIPLLVALPILALLILWSVNQALKPLEEAAKEVSSRDPDHLEELSIKRCPTETRPLVDGINSLLDRLKRELEKERRFTSDASHELRTPLAALRTQAEVAMNASHPEEQRHALEQIICAVDRTGHLVSQLLTLARLDPDATLEQREEIDLHALVSEVLRELAPQAVEKNTDLSLTSDPGNGLAKTQGNPAMLSVLVRNLVDNAIRYTPEHGNVHVIVKSSEAGATLEVQDSGPGITHEELTRVFDRFYRIPGAISDGSGLGLSIVKRIVDLHRGSIELKGPPGLLARVHLPRP